MGMDNGRMPNMTFHYNDSVLNDHAGGIFCPRSGHCTGEGDSEACVFFIYVTTFYAPTLEVQDWGKITVFRKPRAVPKQGGGDFDVLVQVRVEVLPAKGEVITNNAFYLKLGSTARVWRN